MSANPLPLLIFVFLAFPMAGLAQDFQLAGREISLALLKRGDPTPVKLPEGEVRLITRSVTLKRAESLRKLLQTNGVFLDAESLSLVYDLNPNLDNAAALSPGSTLVLPRVTGGLALRRALSRGDLVALTLDQKRKNELRGEVERLSVLSPSVSKLEPAPDATPQAQATTLRSIEGVLGALDFVRKGLILNRQFPASREMLSQLTADAGQLRSLLEVTLSTDGRLDAPRREQIRLIEEDLIAKMAAFDEIRGDATPSSRQDVRVVVKTIRPDDGVQVSNLRIYYAREAHYFLKRGEEKAFGKLSSPSEEILPMGNYRIWARRDGDPSPVSEAIPVTVRKRADGNAYFVDLTVNR